VVRFDLTGRRGRKVWLVLAPQTVVPRHPDKKLSKVANVRMLYRSAGSADYLCSTTPDDRKERDRNKSLGPPPWNRYRRQNPSVFLTTNPKRDNDRSPVGRPTRTRLEKVLAAMRRHTRVGTSATTSRRLSTSSEF
jgi:hypothetical protein